MAFDPTTDSWAPGEPPVGNASALPPDPDKPTGSASSESVIPGYDTRKVTSDLAGVASQKLGDDNYIRSEFDSRMQENRGRMDRALQLETATANDPALTHPWNADRERADRIKGPLENFGSIGTIFALAASAFTRTPMTSALNAGAAAVSAMRDNDELAYKSAYQVWKDNTDLVQKRFNMERAVYDDATKLASTDLATTRTKLSIAAAQFEDTKILTMLDNGMDADVFKTLEARTNSFDKWVKAKNDFEELNLVNDISQQKFQEWKQAHPPADPNNLTPQEHLEQYKAKNQFMLEAKHQVAQSKSVARTGSNPNQQQYDLIRQKYEGDPDAETKIADEYAQFIRNQKVTGGAGGGTRPGTPSDDNQKMDADIKAEHRDWSSSQIIEERNRRIKESKESKRPSAQSENAKTLADIKADVKNEHPDWTAGKIDAEANKRVAQSKAVISGNRADDLRGQIGRIDRANEVIDRVEGLMKTHKMITGLGGTVSRRGEVIGNVLGGSNSTAYNEFKSDLAILKDWWERLENNALTQGRPLSAAEKRVGDIIPGLSIGDTVQHTADQLNRVKKIFTEMRAENEGRLKGEAPSAAPPAAKPSWRTLAIPDNP